MQPNWWGWGWGPGHQETAEFKILEAFFTAAYGLRKRIRDIESPRDYAHWKLTFIDGGTMAVPV
jgi:hypothetical protein